MRSLLVIACTLAACAPLHSTGSETSSPDPAGSPDLTGSTWRLAELQSMDDSQGITRPGDQETYRLDFAPGGRVAVQLDCNRGAGSWTADGAGRLTFGPLATTRAMCPACSIAGKVAQDLADVRSFQRKDGKLNMSLMADGGIMIWVQER